MDIVIGGIYILDDDWKEYDEPIFDSRPVIALTEKGGYFEAVSLDTLFANSKKENQLMIEYYVDSVKYISAISCDVIKTYPIRCIKSCIGYVDTHILREILKKAARFIKNGLDEDAGLILDVPKDAKSNSNKDSSNVSSGISITDPEKFFDIINKTQQDIMALTKYAKEARKKTYIWKERLIGFFFGILASLIASAIWENKQDIILWLSNYINSSL